jgi:RimJ/RimL family protein N-acetyltransferase
LDELELSYHIYSSDHAGKGIATEAVKLLTGYLFDRLKYNRIRLIIHPDNAASKRVAEKCGYKFEGTARGAWFHKGRNHDVDVFALLRDEYYS